MQSLNVNCLNDKAINFDSLLQEYFRLTREECTYIEVS